MTPLALTLDDGRPVSKRGVIYDVPDEHLTPVGTEDCRCGDEMLVCTTVLGGRVRLHRCTNRAAVPNRSTR